MLLNALVVRLIFLIAARIHSLQSLPTSKNFPLIPALHYPSNPRYATISRVHSISFLSVALDNAQYPSSLPSLNSVLTAMNFCFRHWSFNWLSFRAVPISPRNRDSRAPSICETPPKFQTASTACFSFQEVLVNPEPNLRLKVTHSYP